MVWPMASTTAIYRLPIFSYSQKGWQALAEAVDPDGKLCWVQPIGADPKKVTRDMTELYGPGAFLMTACEVYKLCSDKD